MSLVPKRTLASQRRSSIRNVSDNIAALKKRCDELGLENAVMREMLGVLRADPCASTEDLGNTNKTVGVDSVRKWFGLSALSKSNGLKRSTLCYTKACWPAQTHCQDMRAQRGRIRLSQDLADLTHRARPRLPGEVRQASCDTRGPGRQMCVRAISLQLPIESRRQMSR